MKGRSWFLVIAAVAGVMIGIGTFKFKMVVILMITLFLIFLAILIFDITRRPVKTKRKTVRLSLKEGSTSYKVEFLVIIKGTAEMRALMTSPDHWLNLIRLPIDQIDSTNAVQNTVQSCIQATTRNYNTTTSTRGMKKLEIVLIVVAPERDKPA